MTNAPARKALVVFDGAHCERLRKAFGSRFPFLALIEKFGEPISASIYFHDARDEAEAGRLDRLYGYLKHINVEVAGVGPEKMEQGQRERYGTNLVELALETERRAASTDHVILVAGDRKLLPLVLALRESGKSVTIVSSLEVPQSIRPATALLDAADQFLDVTDLLADENNGRHDH
ncbi:MULTISPECIES: NYN domain-containing protein [Hyphomicrobiales]|jgi:hypothetical protein|uniref:NYN domain-containing protein n=1 Tax=Pannonibacter phragmitetus TaxID=121719 RepID=A0A0U3EQ15_9HYPH|nr:MULTISPECIES: NYN domain-containing protein [Hyphomicrobiales]ALV28335.1 hypothetical protein APZ00_15735 [Pannonibacter phragmitetus]KAB2751928.1 NYN domain-containing protein [Brucella anthropi]